MDGSNFDPAPIRAYSPISLEGTVSTEAVMTQEDDSPWDVGLTPGTIELPFDGDDLDNVPANGTAALATSRIPEQDPLLKIAEEGRSAAAKMRAPIAVQAPPGAPAVLPGGAGAAMPALGVPAMAGGCFNGLLFYMRDVLSGFGNMTHGALRASTTWGGMSGVGMGGLVAVVLFKGPFPDVLPVGAKIGICAGVALGVGLVVGIAYERCKED